MAANDGNTIRGRTRQVAQYDVPQVAQASDLLSQIAASDVTKSTYGLRCERRRLRNPRCRRRGGPAVTRWCQSDIDYYQQFWKCQTQVTSLMPFIRPNLVCNFVQFVSVQVHQTVGGHNYLHCLAGEGVLAV